MTTCKKLFTLALLSALSFLTFSCGFLSSGDISKTEGTDVASSEQNILVNMNKQISALEAHYPRQIQYLKPGFRRNVLTPSVVQGFTPTRVKMQNGSQSYLYLSGFARSSLVPGSKPSASSSLVVLPSAGDQAQGEY